MKNYCITCIASLLFLGGRTTHSKFKIPLDFFENNTCSIKQNTNLTHLMIQADLIIWDEEKIVLLGGDFRQILPVISRAQRHDIVHSCINKSNLWDYCKIFMLSTNMRVRDITPSGEQHMLAWEFNRWLLQLGDGKVEAKCKMEKMLHHGQKYHINILSNQLMMH